MRRVIVIFPIILFLGLALSNIGFAIDIPIPIDLEESSAISRIGEKTTISSIRESSSFGGSSIRINKRILHPNVKEYFPENPIYVEVIITFIDYVDSIRLVEAFDPELRVKNITFVETYGVYQRYDALNVLNNFSEINNTDIKNISKNAEIKSLNENIDNGNIHFKNGIMYAYIRDMRPGMSFIYTYWVNASRPGYFKTYTSISSDYGENYEELPIDIEEISPQLMLEFENEEKIAYVGEKIPLTYRIYYIGGTPCNPYKCQVIFDQSNKYELDYLLSNESLLKNNFTLIYNFIKYNLSGEYSLPGVQIAGKYYSPKKYITIKSGFDDITNERTVGIITALGAIFSLMFNFILYKRESYQKGELNKLKNRLDRGDVAKARRNPNLKKFK